MDVEFLERLRKLAGEDGVRSEEPMSLHTSFRIGGPAETYVSPPDAAALVNVVGLCREYQKPFFVLGKGSNLLVNDDGVRGVMISTERMGGVRIPAGELRAEGTPADVPRDGEVPAGRPPRAAADPSIPAAVPHIPVEAEAGISLARLARIAKEASLAGLEFAAQIPGSLGGAVVMNAGAYGGEMKDILEYVTVLAPDGAVRRLPAEELALGYRTSCVSEKGYIVLSAGLLLTPGDPEAIQATMDDLAARRKAKQPLEYPSAGSMFKRPPGYFAGKLIEEAGLRGFAVGGAQVSEKHCGFVINRGNATAKDVRTLCDEVRRVVWEKFGVNLEMEVRYLEFPAARNGWL